MSRSPTDLYGYGAVFVFQYGDVPVVGWVDRPSVGIEDQALGGLQPTGLEVVNQMLLFVAEAEKGIGADIDRGPVGGGPRVVVVDRAGIRIAPVIGLEPTAIRSYDREREYPK